MLPVIRHCAIHVGHITMVGVLVLFLAAPSYTLAYPIAGVNPDQRPVGAPVLGPLVKDNAWYRRALHGVQPPYPATLRFLEDQGRWFTPFIHPGMTGRYDIRGWHRRVR